MKFPSFSMALYNVTILCVDQIFAEIIDDVIKLPALLSTLFKYFRTIVKLNLLEMHKKSYIIQNSSFNRNGAVSHIRQRISIHNNCVI